MTEKGKEIVIVVEDDVIVESADENVVDNVTKVVEDVIGGDGAIEPQPGMKFKDEKELFAFYKKYAYDLGFPVRKRNSKKGDDGVVNYITLTCSREGKRSYSTSSVLKPQPTIQTGYGARITASSDVNGIWRICTVHLEHNHKTSPSKSRLYRCNRELSAHVKRKLEVNDVAGIPLHKSYNSTVVELGGYENMTFVEKDCRNYVENVRRLRLGEGDAAAIQAYFTQMQSKCSGFFFCMDLDEEGRLRNVFWADSRCRQAYKEFDDVVTFDTTYLTNKYDMPFAPFVGVNHHGQSTLFGCGLLSNENTETFVWLFKTWLQCMHCRAPNAIITDQDRAMQNAIQIVFPNTKHRWCLWHILKKLPEKFGYHAEKASIFHYINGLVYDSQATDEFEQGWTVMTNTYNLQNNEWLSGLYENRGRWVPCYLNTFFWAGMSMTQRSESINAFFDEYVHSKTSLKQFVEQYERALRSRIEKEFQADFKSFAQMVPCATKYAMEKQFQSVYTISKLREFQEEMTGKVYCDIISKADDFMGTKYKVIEDVIVDDRLHRKKYTVSFRMDDCHIICSCHLFEVRGILCKHAISVLLHNGITAVPEMYILQRWRRDVRRAHTRVAVSYDGLVRTPKQSRYDSLVEEFATLADIVANDEDQTHQLLAWIRDQYREMPNAQSFSGSNVMSRPISNAHTQKIASNETGSGSIQDPLNSKRKGAPRKLHKKSPLELCSKKSKATSTSVKGKRPRCEQTKLGNDVHIDQTPATLPQLEGYAMPYHPQVAYNNVTNMGLCHGVQTPATYDGIVIPYNARSAKENTNKD